MQSNASFGLKCPNCNSTMDVRVSIGSGDQLCPNCNTKMVPNVGGNVTSMNVDCKKCNSSFGMINSDRCPNCEEPFSSSS